MHAGMRENCGRRHFGLGGGRGRWNAPLGNRSGAQRAERNAISEGKCERANGERRERARKPLCSRVVPLFLRSILFILTSIDNYPSRLTPTKYLWPMALRVAPARRPDSLSHHRSDQIMVRYGEERGRFTELHIRLVPYIGALDNDLSVAGLH
jgi:hypothetical protein